MSQSGRWLLAAVVLVGVIVGVIGGWAFVRSDLYPVAALRGEPLAADEDPVVNPNSAWRVVVIERLSACDNRPGLKKIYVTVLDERGEPLPWAEVRFDVEPSSGIAYDHMNVWGRTNERGYLDWDHLGVPTHYLMWVGLEEDPLVTNLRTDFGNEYCCPSGSMLCWRPINRPGIFSWRLVVQAK